jgi:hypothetical protein
MVLALRAERTDNEVTLKHILDWNAWLATHLFIPASLTVVLAATGSRRRSRATADGSRPPRWPTPAACWRWRGSTT